MIIPILRILQPESSTQNLYDNTSPQAVNAPINLQPITAKILQIKIILTNKPPVDTPQKPKALMPKKDGGGNQR